MSTNILRLYLTFYTPFNLQQLLNVLDSTQDDLKCPKIPHKRIAKLRYNFYLNLFPSKKYAPCRLNTLSNKG